MQTEIGWVLVKEVKGPPRNQGYVLEFVILAPAIIEIKRFPLVSEIVHDDIFDSGQGVMPFAIQIRVIEVGFVMERGESAFVFG